MNSSRRVCLLLTGLVLLAGCLTSKVEKHQVLRPGEGCPEVFEAVYPMPTSSMTAGVVPCQSPLKDPRDGTLIEMQRSAGGLGDYLVPEGRYGVKSGELLRIDCATGRPLGVVRR